MDYTAKQSQEGDDEVAESRRLNGQKVLKRLRKSRVGMKERGHEDRTARLNKR